MSRIHLAIVAPELSVTVRLKELAEEFDYKFENFESSDKFAEASTDKQIVMVVLSAISMSNQQEIAGHVQVIKQFAQDAFIVVVAEKRISPDDAAFIKKSGANLIFLENNFYETSQIEYVCSQVIRGSLVPIKANELKIQTQVDFNVMVMMPLNKKVLPIVTTGTLIADTKYKRLQEANELYIRRDDLAKFRAYCEKNLDLTAGGLESRCRLQYLSLCQAHANLIFLLIDQAEAASFAQGKQLIEECDNLASNLLINLATVPDPWAILNNSSIGESGSVERSTSIAAMAGVLALQLDGVEANEVIMAGLLSDFGLLDFHPKSLKKIRQTGITSLNAEEMQAYHQHPIASVNLCLSRRLPLPDKVKTIIMTSHEQGNGKGFPKRIPGERVPVESQVIQFCQLVDDASIVRLGEAKKNIKDIQKKLLQSEFEKSVHFRLDFIQKIKSILA